MFDKIKEMNKLRQLQNAIKKQKITLKNEGIEVIMRGDFEVVSITLNPELETEKQEEILMGLLKQAREKMQARLQKDFADQMPSL